MKSYSNQIKFKNLNSRRSSQDCVVNIIQPVVEIYIKKYVNEI